MMKESKNQSWSDRILAALRINEGLSRVKALQALKQQSPREVLDGVVTLLHHPEEKVRRRAGSALTFFSKLHGEPINVEQKSDELARYLRQGEDPRVRMSCAGVLMSVSGPTVNEAYLQALQDSESMVVQLACLEVGDRGTAEGTTALFDTLNHPNWRVRLEACKALITQKTADQRVVDTLEMMSQEPEAAVYDAEVEDTAEMCKVFLEALGKGDEIGNCWGKLPTIIDRARQVVGQSSNE